MDNQTQALLWYSVLVILVAWAGGAIPLYFKENRKMLHLFISFGAGVLLGAAFLHMIPDAAGYIGPKLGIPILFGFLMLYILEKFIMTHPCPADSCEYHTVGLSAFFGLSLHSFITGLALGAGILVPKLGFIVFLAVVLHKLPASLSLASLLVKENYSNLKILLTILLFSVMVPVGAAVTYFLAEHTSLTVIGYLIAFSAGTFLHVAADDLLPEIHHDGQDRIIRLLVFFVGLFIMWLVTQL